MNILLFGVGCVGKTTTGRILAEKLKYDFIDLDEEIQTRTGMSMNAFANTYFIPYGRYRIKGQILSDLVSRSGGDSVIAVSPIYYVKFFSPLLSRDDVRAIVLQDTEEAIFQRVVFTDDQDLPYEDELYKEKYRTQILRTIREEIRYARRVFDRIECKCFIGGRPAERVAEELAALIGSSGNGTV